MQDTTCYLKTYTDTDEDYYYVRETLFFESLEELLKDKERKDEVIYQCKRVTKETLKNEQENNLQTV